MAFVSIVIPVYNVKDFLRQSLDSIFCQKDISDCEIIIINDGSTDGSREIIREYELRYKNIRVIDKLNEGVSATRNRGIEAASGDYIFFMDADDLLSPFFFSTIIPLLKEHTPDILAWNYLAFYRRPKFVHVAKPEIVSLECGTIHNSAFNNLMKAGCATSLWTKIIRRDIVRELRFDTGMSYDEDLFFSWKTILRARDIKYLDYSLYYYRQTISSAVSRFHPNLYEKYCKAFEEIQAFALKTGVECTELSKDIDYHFACRIPTLTRMECRAPYSKENKLKHLREVLDDNRIKRALDTDTRLIGNIFNFARQGNIEKMLRLVNLEILKAKILRPIKLLVK